MCVLVSAWWVGIISCVLDPIGEKRLDPHNIPILPNPKVIVEYETKYRIAVIVLGGSLELLHESSYGLATHVVRLT